MSLASSNYRSWQARVIGEDPLQTLLTITQTLGFIRSMQAPPAYYSPHGSMGALRPSPVQLRLVSALAEAVLESQLYSSSQRRTLGGYSEDPPPYESIEGVRVSPPQSGVFTGWYRGVNQPNLMYDTAARIFEVDNEQFESSEGATSQGTNLDEWSGQSNRDPDDDDQDEYEYDEDEDDTHAWPVGSALNGPASPVLGSGHPPLSPEQSVVSFDDDGNSIDNWPVRLTREGNRDGRLRSRSWRSESPGPGTRTPLTVSSLTGSVRNWPISPAAAVLDFNTRPSRSQSDWPTFLSPSASDNNDEYYDNVRNRDEYIEEGDDDPPFPGGFPVLHSPGEATIEETISAHVEAPSPEITEPTATDRHTSASQFTTHSDGKTTLSWFRGHLAMSEASDSGAEPQREPDADFDSLREYSLPDSRSSSRQGNLTAWLRRLFRRGGRSREPLRQVQDQGEQQRGQVTPMSPSIDTPVSSVSRSLRSTLFDDGNDNDDAQRHLEPTLPELSSSSAVLSRSPPPSYRSPGVSSSSWNSGRRPRSASVPGELTLSSSDVARDLSFTNSTSTPTAELLSALSSIGPPDLLRLAASSLMSLSSRMSQAPNPLSSAESVV